jgi:DeoR family transcriptional regulator, fructose operon transcriptional repressor
MARSAAQLMPAQRRRELLRVVESSGHATVGELADRFSVSPDTIRRDLDALAAGGQLTRARGGALSSTDAANADEPVAARTDQGSEAKHRIAMATIDLLSDGQTVFLNGGTTTLAVAGQLEQRRDMTVITSNLLVPAALDPRHVREVYLVGGSVRLNAGVTVGPLVFPAVGGTVSQAIHADVAVIGIGGVSSDSGFSITNMHEAEMTRSMLDLAGRKLIVCDSSKFERFIFAPVAPLGSADVLITDERPGKALADALRAAGVEVVVA